MGDFAYSISLGFYTGEGARRRMNEGDESQPESRISLKKDFQECIDAFPFPFQFPCSSTKSQQSRAREQAYDERWHIEKGAKMF